MFSISICVFKREPPTHPALVFSSILFSSIPVAEQINQHTQEIPMHTQQWAAPRADERGLLFLQEPFSSQASATHMTFQQPELLVSEFLSSMPEATQELEPTVICWCHTFNQDGVILAQWMTLCWNSDSKPAMPKHLYWPSS